MLDKRTHETVLLHEAVDLLDLQPGMVVFEGTLGNGGHTTRICEKVGSTGTIIATDLDDQAIHVAKRRLTETCCEAKVIIVQDNFRNAGSILRDSNIEQGHLNAALFDLGLRTEQVFDSNRGFSFNSDNEPLYMTFSSSPEKTVTAQDVLNDWSEELIADILYAFGDERRSRRIARSIVQAREKKPFVNVKDLLDVLEPIVGKKRPGKGHPAAKIFQAIRIAVNDEYGAIEKALTDIHDHLAVGGRTSVISFHSGEDRIVKKWIKQHLDTKSVQVITKKPLIPSNDEINNNPRSRSSKLRVWRKLAT